MTFYQIEQDLKEILKENTAARCDDMTLYASYVYSKLGAGERGEGWLVKVFSDTRFRILHHIASYESVSRVRRKLQENYIELRPSEKDIAERKRLIKNYRLYAKGVKD